MFCPRCGSTQDEELKFCKSCGANLYAVRKAVDTRETSHRSDSGKPWFAEMAISDAESKRRKEELDHSRGIAPEVSRYKEIKAGVITGSIGLGVAIFLYVFMQGLILSGKVQSDTAEILSRLWVVGVIPLLVGSALIVNGALVSKKLAKLVRQAAQPALAERESNLLELRSADTTEFIPSDFSVTDGTTKHLNSDEQRH
jgi:hypothetical protein